MTTHDDEMVMTDHPREEQNSATLTAANQSSRGPPCDYDVLLGRGLGHQSHKGNQIFNALILGYCPMYQAASNGRKVQIANRIVERVLSLGGRFIQEKRSYQGDDGGDVNNTHYVAIPPRQAVEKVRHAIQYQLRKMLAQHPHRSRPLASRVNASSLPHVTTCGSSNMNRTLHRPVPMRTMAPEQPHPIRHYVLPIIRPTSTITNQCDTDGMFHNPKNTEHRSGGIWKTQVGGQPPLSSPLHGHNTGLIHNNVDKNISGNQPHNNHTDDNNVISASLPTEPGLHTEHGRNLLTKAEQCLRYYQSQPILPSGPNNRSHLEGGPLESLLIAALTKSLLQSRTNHCVHTMEPTGGECHNDLVVHQDMGSSNPEDNSFESLIIAKLKSSIDSRQHHGNDNTTSTCQRIQDPTCCHYNEDVLPQQHKQQQQFQVPTTTPYDLYRKKTPIARWIRRGRATESGIQRPFPSQPHVTPHRPTTSTTTQNDNGHNNDPAGNGQNCPKCP